jgi:hypothetical protein
MRKTNFSLRLQPSLMEEARQAAESDGVSMNQLIIVALAEKLSALRTGRYFQERIRRAERSEPEQTPGRAGVRNPSTERNEISIGRLPVLIATVSGLNGSSKKRQPEAQPAPAPDLAPDGECAGETSKPAGRATPQFGKLKRQLEKARGR